jgi:OOP family OmpA-OmpF porin
MTAATAVALALLLAGCGQEGTRGANEGADAGAPSSIERNAQPPAPRSIMPPSAAPAPSPPPPLAPITESISFAQGGSELDDAAKAALDRLIASPTTASGGAIVLRGSSDSAGSDGDNLAVSRKRAEAVAAYLAEKGIAPDRLTLIALGEGRPVAPNVNLDGSDNPEGRARNRRVDVTISPGEAAATADGGDGAANVAAPAAASPEARAGDHP